jgi:predicted anti-sigma-YlaC factor YlaD
MSEIKITCKVVMDHICENLGEDLNSEKCIAIKKHLDSCEDCKNYFSSVERTIKFYREYNIEIPNEAHERLLNVLGLKN